MRKDCKNYGTSLCADFNCDEDYPGRIIPDEQGTIHSHHWPGVPKGFRYTHKRGHIPHGHNGALYGSYGGMVPVDQSPPRVPEPYDEGPLLAAVDEYGITLTVNDDEAKKWEPGAPAPSERIKALALAKAEGFKTWVSLEPIIYPEHTLSFIEQTAPFTDLYRVGKLNHIDPPVPLIWGRVARDMIVALEKVGATYYIKHDLARYIDKPGGIKGGPNWK